MNSALNDYPPAVSQAQLDHILSTIKDWTIAHGLAVRPSPDLISSSADPHGVAAIPAPVTLFPSLFPRNCFEEAKSIQQAYNELYAKISMNEEWLGEIIKDLIEVDDFIEKLWNVHLRVKKEGYVQPISLGLFRSDYMVHIDDKQSSPQIRQVEFNTISSSFGGLSTQVSLLHKYLLHTDSYPSSQALKQATLPVNNATEALSIGLVTAHDHYESSKSELGLPICVLFVVQDPERNIFDQRHLEYFLQNRSITTFRQSFSSITKYTRVDNDAKRTLIYTPPHSPTTDYEVSVVYFRATYTPTDYLSETDWEARYQLERSAAIKCPSILTHLAGSKKVQQVLATPLSSHLERFLEAGLAEGVRQSFAAIYPLDDSEAGKQAKTIANDLDRSRGYVLKPQREGGGNNIYRQAIPPFLKSLGDESQWRGHILMELIEPPSQKNSIFRGGVLKTGEIIAELGIFGTCLWNSNGKIYHNENAGYLLRTKGRESEEGGVAAGFGAIDSVCLVDG